jgi:hypothetical protein
MGVVYTHFCVPRWFLFHNLQLLDMENDKLRTNTCSIPRDMPGTV